MGIWRDSSARLLATRLLHWMGKAASIFYVFVQNTDGDTYCRITAMNNTAWMNTQDTIAEQSGVPKNPFRAAQSVAPESRHP